MGILEMFREAGIVAKLSLLLALVPLGAGVAYAVRPTEAKLALMRPLCLAGLFGALTGTLAGLLNVFQFAATKTDATIISGVPLLGFSESLVPLFVASGSLTVAWLCVALGMRRQV
jgi:hypothetical protein